MRKANEIQTETTISASAATVWRILTDLDAYREWNPFVVECQGIVQQGEILRNSISLNGKISHFTPRVTRVEENRLFEWLGSGLFGGFRGRHSFRLEQADNGSATKLIHGEQFGGILAGPILMMIGDATRQGFEAMNAALKKRAESQF